MSSKLTYKYKYNEKKMWITIFSDNNNNNNIFKEKEDHVVIHN